MRRRSSWQPLWHGQRARHLPLHLAGLGGRRGGAAAMPPLHARHLPRRRLLPIQRRLSGQNHQSTPILRHPLNWRRDRARPSSGKYYSREWSIFPGDEEKMARADHPMHYFSISCNYCFFGPNSLVWRMTMKPFSSLGPLGFISAQSLCYFLVTPSTPF